MADLNRVAAINKAIAESPTASKGFVAASSNPTASARASGAYNNPADRPSATATRAEPTDEELGIGKYAGKTPLQPTPQPGQMTPTTPALPSALPSSTSQATPEQIQQVANATKSVQSLSQQIGDQYKTGLANVQAQGAPAPTTQGGAASAIKASLPPQQYDSAYVDQSLEQEPVYAQLLDTFADIMSPPKQTESLVQQYEALRKSSGIDEINTELMNTKRIIEGTEDDIRAEVTAANGFATDSQILALASARNKTLIKNYNVLLDTRQSLTEQINTSIQLAGQDREYAQERMNQQLNIGMKIMEYRDKFKQNAVENYNNIVKSVGYAGLLQATGGDPYQTSLIEKTLGLGVGGLAQLASQPNLDDELRREQIKTEQAQRANIYSQIESRNAPASAKPPTQDQLKVAGYKDRLVESNKIIADIGGKFTGKDSFLAGLLPNFLKSSDRQSFDQAQRNFINAVLRRESGASISPEEFDNAKKQYFPQPGDTQNTVQQKASNRQTVISSFIRESGNAPTSSYVVAPDGQEIEIID